MTAKIPSRRCIGRALMLEQRENIVAEPIAAPPLWKSSDQGAGDLSATIGLGARGLTGALETIAEVSQEQESIMAGSVNKVILVGNLGKDPEIRRTQDGRPIANLSVATSDTWRDKATGERREKTEWHRVVIFNEGLCRVAEQYLKKGSKVYLEGQLADPQMAGQGRPGQVLHRGGAAELQFAADHARPGRRIGGGDFGSDEGDFGASGPSTRERKPAMAGAGRRGDMDDEIPF